MLLNDVKGRANFVFLMPHLAGNWKEEITFSVLLCYKKHGAAIIFNFF